ncbi:MAG: hypothetical protein L6V85_07885 [Clostridiales bacterium]|nr:MAG: hypothetical protein L6V85_07885 [Clostridiales bacterium]
MKHSKKIAALIILLLMCAVLINPERYLSSVKDGVIFVLGGGTSRAFSLSFSQEC